ncbi:hypothetical protein PR001_g32422, partial [Phytophthora rubi]
MRDFYETHPSCDLPGSSDAPNHHNATCLDEYKRIVKTMKLATLAVVAVAAVATVSAADQPSLRTVNTPVEAAPAAAKTPAGNDKKEQCGGWGGGWGG